MQPYSDVVEISRGSPHRADVSRNASPAVSGTAATLARPRRQRVDSSRRRTLNGTLLPRRRYSFGLRQQRHSPEAHRAGEQGESGGRGHDEQAERERQSDGVREERP